MRNLNRFVFDCSFLFQFLFVKFVQRKVVFLFLLKFQHLLLLGLGQSQFTLLFLLSHPLLQILILERFPYDFLC